VRHGYAYIDNRLETGYKMIEEARRWDSETRLVVKELFGRPTRVNLAAWIAVRVEPTFYLLEAQTALGMSAEAASAVSHELSRLVRLGMLSRTQVDRRVYFARRENPMWSAFQEIAKAADQLSSRQPAVVDDASGQFKSE
jgi:hypothetical protein